MQTIRGRECRLVEFEVQDESCASGRKIKKTVYQEVNNICGVVPRPWSRPPTTNIKRQTAVNDPETPGSSWEIYMTNLP
jgi:hypothetical protein